MRRNKSLARPAREEDSKSKPKHSISKSKEFDDDDTQESGQELRHKVRLLSKPDSIWMPIDFRFLEEKEPMVDVDAETLRREENEHVINDALSMVKVENLDDPGIYHLLRVNLNDMVKSLDDDNWRFEREAWCER